MKLDRKCMYSTEVLSFTSYYSKRIYGFPNPKHKGNSSLLLEMKNKDSNAINHFAHLLDDWLPEDSMICVLPSDEMNIHYSGLYEVASLLGNSRKRINISHCLEFQSFRAGSGHFITQLMIKEPELVKGNTVVLLNDLMITGKTLQRGMDLLIQSGCRRVLPRTIAKQMGKHSQ
jgi:hypothetical protein